MVRVRGHPMRLPDGRITWRHTHNRTVGKSAGGVGVLVAVVVGLFVLGHDGNGSHSLAGRSPVFNPVVPNSIWQLPPSIGASTPTSTVRGGDGQSGPYWRGVWLMNYWEDEGDCAVGWYWVVQPGTAGMYALKTGCFPANWTAEINNTCRNSGLTGVTCAVWDPDKIMSRYNRHGNLLVVALTQACLDRAHLDSYSQGDLHQDCVTWPRPS
ncbi:hypothetical protein [Mycobacteroides abscessus]|uniref:hypothetical protein n=1 Tax=Mycobacteroides abscessus TaxID=36809 RepID=UPI001878F420